MVKTKDWSAHRFSETFVKSDRRRLSGLPNRTILGLPNRTIFTESYPFGFTESYPFYRIALRSNCQVGSPAADQLSMNEK